MEHKHYYSGLSNQEVLESRDKHGKNILTPPKREPIWKLFLEKFEDPIIRILLIAALLSLGISFVNKEFAETIGIFCAIFLATTIAFWFELDANKKFDLLNQVNDDTPIKVIRNSVICEIPKKDIVVGDIVVVDIGEEIPADGQLIESVSLQIDESCLTGEPICMKTTLSENFDHDATYPSNHVMRGTTVKDGHAIFIVKKVGDQTEFGKVAERSTEISGEETPLNQQLDKLAKLIGVIGFALAVFTFGTRFIKDIIWGDASYTFSQLYLVLSIILGVFIAGVKIWIPIIYDAFELAGKEKEMPKSVEEKGWLMWIGLGLLSFLVLLGLGFIFKVNPFLSESWLDTHHAELLLQYLMVSVALIVVAVPEGLPMSVTLSLALSMRKMYQSNNLVRKMHACETMGATTIICTDKTGTLTKNQMQVNEFQLYDSEKYSFLHENISVNSTAHLDFSDSEKIKTLGNPTEAALLLWLNDNDVNYLNLREQNCVFEQLTFSTERKYMATMAESASTRQKVLYVKGAPEIVMSKCKYVSVKGDLIPIEEYKDSINKQLIEYQEQCFRTIGFAYEVLNDDKPRFENNNLINTELIFLGICAISDPIRHDVPDAVSKCLHAGIQVKIVTGDTYGTAKEIGKQIGILSQNILPNQVISGVEFENLNNEEAIKIVQEIKIMYRARPTDKQRLVQLLQKCNEVVAVTGDGTNDAPALNHAHVGLSMGSGTSVAKEASDITLIDDSFASITKAVLWGRSVFLNIQRFILFQLTINVVALTIDFIGAIFWGKLPLTVTQLLWVNLIMDTFAAGALASLPPDPKIMNDKPRNRNHFIVNKAMSIRIFGIGFLFIVILLGLLIYFTFKHEPGNLSTKELTIFFTIFVMLQFWNMFNAKSFASGKSAFHKLFKCYGFLIVACVIFIGQILIVEFGGDVFRTTPLSLKEWILIVTSTSAVLWIGEFYRWIQRKKKSLNSIQ